MEELLQKLPEKVPEPGFYYHYKHDPDGPIEHHAYEVLAVGCHTEEDCALEDAFMVVYRPLQEGSVVEKVGEKLGVPVYDNRPLTMFMEDVTKDGVTRPRFARIEDLDVIAALKEKRDQMYP